MRYSVFVAKYSQMKLVPLFKALSFSLSVIWWLIGEVMRRCFGLFTGGAWFKNVQYSKISFQSLWFDVIGVSQYFYGERVTN